MPTSSNLPNNDAPQEQPGTSPLCEQEQTLAASETEENQGIDWHRLLLRKDRPLPKAGCSYAFYIVLAILMAYLIIMYIQYKK